jgi:MFS family permease
VWGAARLQDAGLSPALASAGASAFQLGMAAGRLLTSRLVGRIPLLGSGVALAAAGIAVCAAPLHPAWIALATLFAGMGLGPLYPVLIDQLVRTPGLAPRRTAAVGALATGTSMLAGPLLLNTIATHVPLRIGFLAAIPPVLLVAVLYGLGRIRVRKSPG